MGFWRALVENVRPGPVLVVRHRVGMACMGHPFASYLSLGVFILSDSINLGVRWSLPTEILFLGFSRSGLGKRKAARVRWRFGSCARCAVVVGRAVVVGHAQATSHPIRSRSIGQGTSHRSGRVLSVRVRLICIKWERERVFRSAVSPSLIGALFPNRYSLFLK